MDDKIRTRIVDTLVTCSGLPAAMFQEGNVIDDLDIDSLEFAEAILDIEDEFHIVIPDSDMEGFTTIGDLFDMVEKKLAVGAKA